MQYSLSLCLFCEYITLAEKQKNNFWMGGGGFLPVCLWKGAFACVYVGEKVCYEKKMW